MGFDSVGCHCRRSQDTVPWRPDLADDDEDALWGYGAQDISVFLRGNERHVMFDHVRRRVSTASVTLPALTGALFLGTAHQIFVFS